MRKTNLKARLLAIMIAATTVGTIGVPVVANASVPPIRTPTQEMAPLPGVKVIGAHKAAITVGEILGAEVATADMSSLTDNNLQMFGTNYNQSPSAYLSNYLYHQAGNTLSDGAKVTQIVSSSYGPGIAEGSSEGSVSLDARPDILLGTAVNGNGFTYSSCLPIGNYDPILISYHVPKLCSQDNYYDPESSTNVTNTMTGVMYEVASAMGTTGRYSNVEGASANPADIASTYEHYVKDLQLYILSQIAINSNVSKKTVAIVGTNSSDYSKLDLYKFVPNNGQTTSRPAEYLKYTTTNVLDTAACSGLTVSDAGVATIDVSSASTFLSGADYVIAMKPTSNAVIISETTRTALAAAGFTATNGKLLETSPDCAYGCYMNSVDNALGMAVLNSQVYPEVLPMNEVAAYFYSKLYHINTSDVDVFVNANFDSLLDFDNSTAYTGDDAITDATAAALIGNCTSRINAGKAYFDMNANALRSTCPDISYVLSTDMED